MTYQVVWTSKFKKDYKAAMKRDWDVAKLDEVINSLANGEKLPEKNRDHNLSGEWQDYRECHILPDWLLIYRYEEGVLVLTLARTGTHSDLFNE